MNFIKRCWAEISVDNLLSNLNEIKNITASEVICVVKSNAYGHGDLEVVSVLEKAGVRFFAVASMTEALRLRNAGCTAEILLLGGCLDDCFSYAVANNITLALYDLDQAKRMSDFAKLSGKKIKTHIKLNTGMSRIGFECFTQKQCENTAQSIKEISGYTGVELCGAFTHFCESDEKDGKTFTALQYSKLKTVRDLVEKSGVNIPLWHAANSGAIANYNEYHLDLVRAGIVLYGVYSGEGYSDSFKPVLSLKSVITQIREIDKGVPVSYGRTFVSDKKMTLATISIGYGDGYPRSLSSKGRVVINGKFASIVGRVCMDQTIVDVTDIDCKVGDTVTVIGDGVTADEIASIDGTINYEILCRLSSRIPRVYVKNGEYKSITEYI